jgi:hypothetical protein
MDECIHYQDDPSECEGSVCFHYGAAYVSTVHLCERHNRMMGKTWCRTIRATSYLICNRERRKRDDA